MTIAILALTWLIIATMIDISAQTDRPLRASLLWPLWIFLIAFVIIASVLLDPDNQRYRDERRAERRSRGILFVLLLGLYGLAAAPAFGQQPPGFVGRTDPVKIEMNRGTLQLVLNGLAKLPFENSAPVIVDFQQQVQRHDAAADAAEKAAKEPKPTPDPAEAPKATESKP